jgi:hypothetical protein
VWTISYLDQRPVDKAGSSPASANSSLRITTPFCSIIPDIHTLYDYNKGIS